MFKWKKIIEFILPLDTLYTCLLLFSQQLYLLPLEDNVHVHNHRHTLQLAMVTYYHLQTWRQ